MGLVLTFLILLGMVVRILYVNVYASAATSPRYPGRTIPNTDVNPYGANFFLAREVEPWKREKTLQMAADAGIGWVKQHFPWEEIEPMRKGDFLHPNTKISTWTKYDRIVEACEKHGLQIVARLDRPPDWTRQDNTYQQGPPDSFQDYGDFVYEFVKHYRGRINYIQIWNEPNIFPEWGNKPVDPAQYVELLKIAYMRAKEADPNVYVLSAPLAMTLGQPHPEPGEWISMSDLDYLRGMYEAGAADYFDILSANAFGMEHPPDDPPDPQVLNFQRVTLQRKIMEDYGDSDKAIWFNEYGWNAAPPSMASDKLIWQRVSEEEQAEYTLRGIELARQEWPWAGVFMIWYFRQVGNIPRERADYYFRLVDPDFTPQRLYFAVQDAAATQSAAGPGLYQETNPNVKTTGSWAHVIDDFASGKAFILSEEPGDGVAFTFRGNGIDLVTRQGEQSGKLLVSLDGHSVPGLPLDEKNRSYVDLYSAAPESQSHIPLVRNVGPKEHVLYLTISDTQNPHATGQVCIIDAFEVTTKEERPFPTLLFSLAVAALIPDGYLLWRVWRHVRWTVRAP
ncbi:MAG: hypothetical protein U9R48_05725 [Chloroflexota bacterium]|nr:hypothetical protein [Chloroflexota bacterium]